MNLTKRLIVGGAAIGAAAAATAGITLAHHAFSAEFDADAPLLIRGTVSRVEWVNPHTWVHVDATSVEGAETVTLDNMNWMVEGGTPNTLLRAGLNRRSLSPGTEVVVRGYQSKDRLCAPRCKANGRDITLPDGSKVFMGSSGTGAPEDGADPNARP